MIKNTTIKTLDDLLVFATVEKIIYTPEYLKAYIQQIKMLCITLNINFILEKVVYWYLKDKFDKYLVSEYFIDLFKLNHLSTSIEYLDFIAELTYLVNQKKQNYIFDINKIIETNQLNYGDELLCDHSTNEVLFTFYQRKLLNKELLKRYLQQHYNITSIDDFTDNMFELAYNIDSDYLTVHSTYNLFVKLYNIYKDK